MKNRKVIIIGGGIAGLTTAHQLRKGGVDVTVLEGDAEVGGLSKTVSYKRFLFDYSAHRFNSSNEKVVRLFKEIVGKHLVYRKKITFIRHWGEYLHYPPRVAELVRVMPKPLLLKASVEFMGAFARELVHPIEKKSFADWTRGYFGKTLSYNMNEKYAEKIWKIPATRLSSDWASTRVGSFKLKDFLIAALFPSHYKRVYNQSDPDTDYFYYCDIGIGYFPNKMADVIGRLGGKIITEARVTAVRRANASSYSVTYTKNGKNNTVSGTDIVSTIPLNNLEKILRDPLPKAVSQAIARLNYLNVMVVNILLNRKHVNNASWIYYPDRDTIFNYVVEFKNWSTKMVRKDKTSLSANITCRPNDSTWKLTDKELIDRVVADMVKTGQINEKEVMGGFVSRVPYAYPVYDIEYKNSLEKVRKFFTSLPHFHLVGRTGNFDYANADKVIADGMLLAERILNA